MKAFHKTEAAKVQDDELQISEWQKVLSQACSAGKTQGVEDALDTIKTIARRRLGLDNKGKERGR